MMFWINGIRKMVTMSKKSTIVCDRCGKEVAHNVGKRFYHLTTILFDRFCIWEGIDNRLDLCDDCSKDFSQVVKESDVDYNEA